MHELSGLNPFERGEHTFPQPVSQDLARSIPITSENAMTEDQIKHMVSRFLGWKLPENFRPDGGISFEPRYNNGTAEGGKREPVGTNLLDATQADAMVRHMLEGLPAE